MVDQTALKSIEDLHRLKTEGVITEEDYKKAKERILFGAGAAAPSPLASVLRQGGPVALPAADDHFAWAILPLRRYADFSGRSCRREFWMFQLVPAAIVVVMILIAGNNGPYSGTEAVGTLAIVSGCLALLGLLVPEVAVQVRRLHDQDRSGLLALLNLVPYVGPVIVFVLMLIEGTRGENRFGPDPVVR